MHVTSLVPFCSIQLEAQCYEVGFDVCVYIETEPGNWRPQRREDSHAQTYQEPFQSHWGHACTWRPQHFEDSHAQERCFFLRNSINMSKPIFTNQVIPSVWVIRHLGADGVPSVLSRREKHRGRYPFQPGPDAQQG